MKPRFVVNPPVATLPQKMGRGLLFAHLLIVPCAFSQATVEGFEFVKYSLLILSALGFVVLAALVETRPSVADLRESLRQPIVIAALIWVGSSIVSTCGSISPHTSFFGHHEDFAGLLTTLAFVVLFLAARILVRTPAHMRMMALAIALSTAFVTGYGLLQAIHGDPLDWDRLSTVADSTRPFASFGHPNFLGAYLVLVAPLLVWFAATCRGIRRVLLLGLGLALLILVVLTLSRAAWLGLAAAGFIGIIGWRMRQQTSIPRWTVVPLLLLIASAAALPAVRERLAGFFDSAGRLTIWTASWQMFLERPLIGWGPDTFGQVFGRFGGIDYWKFDALVTPSRAHNEVLHLLATQGLVGLMAMVFGLFAVGWTLHNAWKLQPQQRGLILALTAALGGFAITELFGFTVIATGSLACVMLGLLARLGQPEEINRSCLAAAKVGPTPIVWRAAQLATITACGWLAVELVVDPWRASICSHEAEKWAIADPDTCLALHEKAVRICPREAVFWNRLATRTEMMAGATANSRSARRLLETSLASYQAAAERDREDGYYRAGVGRALAGLARLGVQPAAEAFTAFDAALKLDPGNAYTYVDACQAALRLGDADRLQHYLDAGLRLHPDCGPLREQVALRCLLLNRPREADTAFRAAYQGKWLRQAEFERSVEIYREFARRVAHLPSSN